MLIVGFGDSITEAKDLPIEQRFLSNIGKVFHCTTINSGVGGDTTAKALVRFVSDVLRHNPNVCILEFGMNDHVMTSFNTPCVSPIEFQSNLQSMINQLQEIHCVPIVCTIHPVIAGDSEHYYYRRHPEKWYSPKGVQGYIPEYNEIVRQLAERNNVVLADIALRWVQYLEDGGKLTTALRSLENSDEDDGVHLTDVGHRLYAECIIKVMKDKMVQQ